MTNDQWIYIMYQIILHPYMYKWPHCDVPETQPAALVTALLSPAARAQI